MRFVKKVVKRNVGRDGKKGSGKGAKPKDSVTIIRNKFKKMRPRLAQAAEAGTTTMPTPQRPATPSEETISDFAAPDWSRVVADVLTQALDVVDVLDAAVDEVAMFHRTFPLGEALGELFRRRAASGKRPLGLVDLVEALAPDARAVGDGTEARARQALLAGLCWNLEGVVAVGSRLTREFGELPDGDPLDAAHERARAIARELHQRRR